MYLDSYSNDNKITKHIIINFALGIDILNSSICNLCNSQNSIDHILKCPNFDYLTCVTEFIQSLKIEAEILWRSDKYHSLISQIGSALHANSLFLHLGALDFNIPQLKHKSVFGMYKNKKLYRFLCKSLINFFQQILVESICKITYVQILKHVIS